MLHKVRSLATILRRDPVEFAQRVAAIAHGRAEPLRVRRPSYAPSPADALPALLATGIGPAAVAALEEDALRETEDAVRERLALLSPHAPYTLTHNADVALARCCYAVCRGLAATCVVETGVGYGVTSAFLLRALEENGGGELHSIDLPPLERGADEYVGALVPPALRARWRLYRGLSRRLLPDVLARAGTIDVFLHDSDHTYDNMRFEFEHAWTRLRDGGALLADDVEGNAAFDELRMRAPHAHAVFGQVEKPGLFGVAIR
jgi:predicted O-methyltransferase YrrM